MCNLCLHAHKIEHILLPKGGIQMALTNTLRKKAKLYIFVPYLGLHVNGTEFKSICTLPYILVPFSFVPFYF